MVQTHCTVPQVSPFHLYLDYDHQANHRGALKADVNHPGHDTRPDLST